MRALGGRRSIGCLLEYPHDVMRRWVSLASVVLDWSQVTSLVPTLRHSILSPPVSPASSVLQPPSAVTHGSLPVSS